MNRSASNLPLPITRKLQTLRRMLGNYVILDGLATTTAALVVIFWLDLALDRFFEFSRPFRGVLLLGLLGLIGYVVWLRIIRRLRGGFDDRRLALVFEHFEPDLDESLVTAVELDDPNVNTGTVHAARYDPELFDQTVRQATAGLENVDVRRFFRYGRLFGRIAVATLLLGSVIGFCAAFGETAGLWFSRNVLISDRDWPRRSRLLIEGFSDGRVRVGRGDSFTLTVRADTDMPLVPDSIRLRLGNRGGNLGGGYRTVLVDQFRVDTLDGTDWRTFTHTFAEMLETLPLSVRGADTTIDGLEIEVVPPPMLTDISLQQKFPTYMERPDRTVSPGSRVTVPDGVSLRIDAETNKPLAEALAVVDREEPKPVETASPSTLNYSLENLRNDTRLEFRLLDVDSLRNRQPIRMDFTILKDQPPTVTARLDGIGSAITPNAVLPTLGELTDDYGLASAVFRYSIERSGVAEGAEEKTEEQAEKSEGETVEAKADKGDVAIGGIGTQQTIFSLDQPFPMADCGVSAGDKFSFWIEATDRFDLDGEAGQTGPSQRWTLEIVTPERLRGLLEVREIALRQRFEVLIGEVELTKELLVEIPLEITEELRAEAEALELAEGEEPDAAEAERRRAELETKKKNLLETVPKEQIEAGRYNISRALRDTAKETYEIRTIVESFRLIRQEMVNNMILTDDDQDRLDRGIMAPLQELIDSDFPDADRLIGELEETLQIQDRPQRDEAQTQREIAVKRFDELLVKMTAIRDSMVSMESFNEVIDILRAIIRQQQQLRQETIEEKNRRLKDLLE